MDYAFNFTRAPPAFVLAARHFIAQRTDTTPIQKNAIADLQSLIGELQSNAAVAKPIDDLIVVGHANHEGFLQIPMFPGQKGLTTFEVLADTLVTSGHAIAIPTSVATAASTVHIRGCNIGKDQNFLNQMKLALGNVVDVTAPVNFDGFRWESDSGAFEYMCHEFFVSSPTKLPDQTAILAAFVAQMTRLAAANTPWLFADGTAVTSDNLKTWIGTGAPFAHEVEDAQLAQSLGSGKRKRTTLKVWHQFRVELQKFPWPATFASVGAIPSDHQAAFEQSIRNDPKFQSDYGSPEYERWGYDDVDDFINGFAGTKDAATAKPGTWSHQVQKGPPAQLVSTGFRWQYTIVQPITQAADPTTPLIFNYYPNAGSADVPIVSLFETDARFFAQST
jgi:hypothetical protein